MGPTPIPIFHSGGVSLTTSILPWASVANSKCDWFVHEKVYIRMGMNVPALWKTEKDTLRFIHGLRSRERTYIGDNSEVEACRTDHRRKSQGISRRWLLDLYAGLFRPSTLITYTHTCLLILTTLPLVSYASF
jgi:hypothetical protein